MSLSSYLDKPSRHRRLGSPDMADNAIRRFFYDNSPNTRGFVREQNKKLGQTETIRPAESPDRPVPFGDLGMAIDYRLRYYFAVTPYRDLVAWTGAQLHRRRLEETYSLAPTLVEGFFVELEAFVGEIGPSGRKLGTARERQLNRFCFVLALFEQMRRINPHPGNLLFAERMSSVCDLLGIADDLWIDDLCSLSKAFYECYKERLSDPVTLNPTFSGSVHIGGADADLILGNRLLEVKTTVTPAITKTMLYQLIGYVLLDYEDEYRLKQVGIYMARQATTLKWNLPDLLDRLHSNNSAPPLAQLRRQFKRAVQSTHLAHRALSASTPLGGPGAGGSSEDPVVVEASLEGL